MCEVKVDGNKTNSKPLNLLDCINACCNKHELVKRIKNLDMLIVSGGGWLNDKWCGRLAHFYRVINRRLLKDKHETISEPYALFIINEPIS